jgi:uncharacterized membrane protein YbhN (UPF0104 family)
MASIEWGWVGLAVTAEAVSVAAMGALYRPLLAAGGVSISRRRGAALGAAASAITATLPAGSAVASGYLFRQFRRAGGNAALAGWAVVVAAALSIAGFAAVVGSGVAVGSGDWLSSIWQVGGIGLAAAALLVAISTMLTRHPALTVRVLGPLFRHLPGRRANRAGREAALTGAVAQLTAIRPRTRLWLLVFLFAVLTWAGDMTTFVLSLHAVGIHHVTLTSAAVAYGAGLATISISLIPAGIGAVEAGMLVGLTSAGIAGSTAVAGIVTYRVVAYVLVAAAGWLVWALLRRDTGRRTVRLAGGPGGPGGTRQLDGHAGHGAGADRAGDLSRRRHAEHPDAIQPRARVLRAAPATAAPPSEEQSEPAA